MTRGFRALRRAPTGGVLVGLALVLIAIVATLASAADPGDDRTPNPNAGGVADAVRQAERAEDERRARRDSAEGRAERERSRRDYRGESDAEALATARRKFPDVVEAPAFKWPPLDRDEKITRYHGPRAAIVREANGKHALLESTIPLVGTTPGGDVAPVDLALRDGGGAFEPKSAPVPVRIPKRAADALSFPDASLHVRLEGARAGSATYGPAARRSRSPTSARSRLPICGSGCGPTASWGVRPWPSRPRSPLAAPRRAVWAVLVASGGAPGMVCVGVTIR